MHHAYLLIGTEAWALAKIPSENSVGSPDVMHRTFERMGIDDARTLIDEAQRAPLKDSHRIFVLAPESITLEAQNALLKLFEEPPRTARFYLIVPRENVLIETLRSRLFLLDREVAERTQDEKQKEFFSASYGARLDMIADRAKRKDDAWFTALLKDFECVAHERRDTTLLTAVIRAQTYARTQGASKKMLLEHLALLLS